MDGSDRPGTAASRRAWKQRGLFLAIVVVASVASICLVHLFKTPSIMVVNAIPIILCGWLFGRRSAPYSALVLFSVTGTYFKLAQLEGMVDPKGLFLGIVSFSIFAAAGYALRSVGDLYERIHKLNDEINDKNRELRDAALKDPLTRLHNRRFVDESLAETVSIFQRQLATPEFAMREIGIADKVLFLMLLDIDHFKRVNDTRGHAAGDQVLVEVAKRIKDAVRFDDSVIRWGGEEFLIVCPMMNPANADFVMLKVLDAVRTKPVALQDGTELWITVSMGAIWIPVFRRHPEAVAFDRAVMIADKALYDAKANGRDHGRLVVALDDGVTTHDGNMPDASAEFYDDPNCCVVRTVGG